MNLTITPNVNTKKHPSFGWVSILKPSSKWVISLSTTLPEEVYVDGFIPFNSENAKFVSNKFRDLEEGILSPKFFPEVKKKLLSILDEIQKQLPLFSKKDRAEVEAILNNPAPDRAMTGNHDLILGDIWGD